LALDFIYYLIFVISSLAKKLVFEWLLSSRAEFDFSDTLIDLTNELGERPFVLLI